MTHPEIMVLRVSLFLKAFGTRKRPKWDWGVNVSSLSRDDDHRQEIDQDARHAAWNEGDEHCQPEPERADTKEFAQSAADPGNDPVVF